MKFVFQILMHEVWLFLFLWTSCHAQLTQDSASRWIYEQEGLVSFWDFQPKEDKAVLEAYGAEPVTLIAGNKKVKFVKGRGIFGPSFLKVEEGGWLHVPREQLGKLDIFGPDAQVTVVAWVKRQSEKPWQAIAGVWDESRHKRQYYLFMNAHSMTQSHTMKRVPCKNRVHGHISALGGKSPGEKAWISYASGGTEVANDQWHMIAMSYDGQFIRVYLDGTLDSAPYSNPFPYPEGIFDGGKDGADFTVGSNSVRGEMTNHFIGHIGGVAIFNRALSSAEIGEIYNLTSLFH
ncbi:LamG domain-containing protein [Catalinimonas sp. 4WD22]|uniref:LamG domain-containing protein n=1 Tax=Catalinimonas locisalis TaxID=3133978 RepID=UPI00310102D7